MRIFRSKLSANTPDKCDYKLNHYIHDKAYMVTSVGINLLITQTLQRYRYHTN